MLRSRLFVSNKLYRDVFLVADAPFGEIAINNVDSVVRKLLQWALDNGMLTRDPPGPPDEISSATMDVARMLDLLNLGLTRTSPQPPEVC